MTATNPGPDALKQELRATLDELEGLRDTLRVRAHLASLEVKTHWNQLDRRFLETRDAIKGMRDDARADLISAARDGLAEVKKGLHDLRDALDRSTH